jgi:uncharacterized membrane protein YuzA (DUF378 family)
MASSIGYKIFVLCIILIIIAALILGWQGLFNNNVVDTINSATFKNQTLKRWFYVILGIAGLYVLVSFGFISKCHRILTSF